MITSTDITAARERKTSRMRILLYNFSWSAFQNLSGCKRAGCYPSLLMIIIHLGDQNNPEDCDGDVGGEKEIETDREKTVQQPSNQWRLQSKYQPSQHAIVLQGEINL